MCARVVVEQVAVVIEGITSTEDEHVLTAVSEDGQHRFKRVMVFEQGLYVNWYHLRPDGSRYDESWRDACDEYNRHTRATGPNWIDHRGQETYAIDGRSLVRAVPDGVQICTSHDLAYNQGQSCPECERESYRRQADQGA